MSNILTIAKKEFKDALRNRWILFATALLTILSISLTFFGSSSVGTIDASNLSVTVVSLSSLSIYLIPLIALLISYDAIVGEAERGTLLLFLTYPVSRSSILMGKFLGHLSILSFAIIFGFGSSGILSAITGGLPAIGDLLPFLLLIITSIILGGVFISFAYLISTIVKERTTAAGLSLFIWVFFVVIFDLILIVLISNSNNIINEKNLQLIMMLNPTDIYRVLNLTSFENVKILSGLSSVVGFIKLGKATMLLIFLSWSIIPLIITNFIFKKKEL